MSNFIFKKINPTPISGSGLVRIYNVELMTHPGKQFAIIFEILTGEHIGKLIRDDKFHVHPTGKYYWRYIKLLRAVACRKYKKLSKNPNINLNQIMSRKCIHAVLSIFKPKNGLRKNIQFQRIKYWTNPFTQRVTKTIINDYEVWTLMHIDQQKKELAEIFGN